MGTTISKKDLPAIGAPLGGGYYAGLFLIGTEQFALVVSPKADGQHDDGPWGEAGTRIDADSCFDGLANTIAMAACDYKLGIWARGLNIAGHDDWYLPSRDELEICYRNLKPTTRENYCTFRDGDNASSIPPGYPYTEESPAQTTVEAFKEGGSEAFRETWYLSSTQSAAYGAFIQGFGGGTQTSDPKSIHTWGRAVRRILVIE